MKKKLIAMIMGSVLLATSTGVFAQEAVEEILPVENPAVVETADEATMSTMEIVDNVYYYDPEIFKPYEMVGSVDGAQCYEMYEILNEVRAEMDVRTGEKYKINPVVLDSRLTDEAMKRAQELNVYYGHTIPMESRGLGVMWHDSENIVIGRNTGKEAMDAFIDSATHLAQMCSKIYVEVGVGNYGSAWVLTFRAVDTPEGHDMTEAEMNSYTTPNKYASCLTNYKRFIPKMFSGYPKSNLNVGETVQLQPYMLSQNLVEPITHYEASIDMYPNSLNWTSSNTGVATVSEAGMVTAKSGGEVTITGEKYGQEVTYDLKVEGSAPEETGGQTPVVGSDWKVKYRTHVQNIGWQDYVADGGMSGTSGQSLRLEGTNIELGEGLEGSIAYRTHVQNVGWQDYVYDGTMAGTQGKGLRLEGIDIRLTGKASLEYDIYYRTHVQNIGWMNWAKNGELSGSAGFGWRLEGLEIQLVPKGDPAPDMGKSVTNDTFKVKE